MVTVFVLNYVRVELLVPEENRRTRGTGGTGEQGKQREQRKKGNRGRRETRGTGKQGNKRSRGTGEKQHMYAQFMERQRANRPETFFRKLKQTS